VGGRGRQTFVEAGVKDQGFSGGVADGPEVADGVAAQEGLREAPDFAGEGEAFSEGVGDREGLAELEPAHGAFKLFVEDGIGVVMKSLHVGAGVEDRGVQRAANVEFGRAAVVDAAGIAGGKGGFCTLAMQQHELRAEEHLRDAIGRNAVYRVVNGGLGRLDEFDAARDGELYNFVEFVAGGKFGRVCGAKRAGFKLQIADGRKRGGIANGGAGGIGFGLVRIVARFGC